jgi:hypothetical protein
MAYLGSGHEQSFDFDDSPRLHAGGGSFFHSHREASECEGRCGQKNMLEYAQCALWDACGLRQRRNDVLPSRKIP